VTSRRIEGGREEELIVMVSVGGVEESAVEDDEESEGIDTMNEVEREGERESSDSGCCCCCISSFSFSFSFSLSSFSFPSCNSCFFSHSLFVIHCVVMMGGANAEASLRRGWERKERGGESDENDEENESTEWESEIDDISSWVIDSVSLIACDDIGIVILCVIDGDVSVMTVWVDWLSSWVVESDDIMSIWECVILSCDCSELSDAVTSTSTCVVGEEEEEDDCTWSSSIESSW
jgi:hypothetical protein